MAHEFETVTFGHTDTLELKFDLYKPSPFPAVEKIPAVIFYHGGGMLAGCRQTSEFQTWLIDATLNSSFLFISADYRLLHPSTGATIISDVQTLFAHLAAHPSLSPHLPSNTSLDLARLAVVGESGGGYPAFAAGLYANPKPKVAFLQYPMGGEILSDWWLRDKGTEPAPWRPQGDPILTRNSDSVRSLFGATPPPEIAWNPYATPLPGKDGAPAPPMTPRVELLQVFWREGRLVDLILGREGISAELRQLPFEEREGRVPEELRGALLQAGLGAGFPASVFLHGTADVLIHDEESTRPWEKLRKAGVKAEMVLVEGAGHVLFDPKNLPFLIKGAREAQGRAWAFVKEELLG